jgi:hypothetical protein
MHVGFWWKSKKERDLSRRSLEDNIKMELRDIRWGGMYWFDLPQDRDRWRALLNMVMNIRVP